MVRYLDKKITVADSCGALPLYLVVVRIHSFDGGLVRRAAAIAILRIHGTNLSLTLRRVGSLKRLQIVSKHELKQSFSPSKIVTETLQHNDN